MSGPQQPVAIPDPSLDDAIDAAFALAREGRWGDAIARLSLINRGTRDPRIEIALVRLRHEGSRHDEHRPGLTAGTERPITLPTTEDGLPVVLPDRLDLDHLHSGFRDFGCVLVPGLLEADTCALFRTHIDETFDSFDRWQADPDLARDVEDRARYEPFRPQELHAAQQLGGRAYTRSTGGIWMVDSPKMLFEIIEVFESLGIGDLVAAHLGERPALSAAKSNLRRTPLHATGGWHQDGSFLGSQISSLDLWIALSDCGRDSPGLEVVPHRFDHLLPAGLDTVVIPHDGVVDACATSGTRIVNHEFRAGDAMIFDHMLVHRTSAPPGMTHERYALETWFFGLSNYPERQIPLLY